MGRNYKGIFSQNMTDRPIFGWINKNSAVKVRKPTIQKSKIIKKWFFQKIDSKGVPWWMLAQKRPTTPKVLIFGDKNSSHEELIQHQFFEKSTFLIFFEFYVFPKVIRIRTQRKNYHLKVLPMSSWDFLDVFCTINEYTTTPRSKNTFCQSTLILLGNSGFSIVGFEWQFLSKMSELWQNVLFDLVVVYSFMVQKTSKSSKNLLEEISSGSC